MTTANNVATVNTTSAAANVNSIHTRALLVWLSISTWTARKYDRQVSEKVNRDHGASSNAGRYNKFLLPGEAESYKTLVGLASVIRAEHYAKTLAWSDEGWRVLPTADYMAYTDWFRGRHAEFMRAFDQFVADYPQQQHDARTLLNGLYSDADYPDVQDMGKRFRLGVTYNPLPRANDVRVDLGSDAIEAIGQGIEDQVTRALTNGVNDGLKRLQTVVARMAERLNDSDAIFRDSLIDNARELCAALKTLNVSNDATLEAVRQEVETKLTAVSPDVLRDDKVARADVAAAADKILADMSALFGN